MKQNVITLIKNIFSLSSKEKQKWMSILDDFDDPILIDEIEQYFASLSENENKLLIKNINTKKALKKLVRRLDKNKKEFIKTSKEKQKEYGIRKSSQ